MRKTKAITMLVGTTLVFSGGGLAATAAEADPSVTPDSVQSALGQAFPEALSGLATESTTRDAKIAMSATGGSTSIDVPTDPTSGIGFTSSSGEKLSIGVPFAASANDAFVVQPGVVAYDNANGSATVPAVKADGSVQISTVIESASAPTRYDYALDLPEGAELVLLESNGAKVKGKDGSTLLNIAQPVAYDSAKNVVPTKYEISGHTLTQVVELSESASYPIVADPWLNCELIGAVSVTYPYPEANRYKVNVTPSTCGEGWVGPLTWGNWEDELRDKLGADADKVNYTVREQLNCHLAGFPLSLPEFNLESWRADQTYTQMAPYNCNYPEGGWGSAS